MNFIIDILVVWRLTHLLQSEDGPYDIFFRLKQWLQPGFWFELLKCFYCLSIWFGIGLGFLRYRFTPETIWYGLGLSGMAIIIQLILDKLEVK